MGPRPFGRGRAAALAAAPGRALASMGPRPFGRGRGILPRRLFAGMCGFNGAATFRSRKVCNGRRNSQIRGKPLQWGRDLSVAEGAGLCQRLGDGAGHASMGPRPFGRGRPLSGGKYNGHTGRFNGAATFRSRKECSGSVSSRLRNGLQWGRDLSVAEGCWSISDSRRLPMLQWGRDLSVAEGHGRALSFLTGTTLQWGRDLSVAEVRTTARSFRP